MKKVVVTGGGPAGMMAAITAAKAGNSVTLLERGNKIGRKLRITGKGRCNVTNDCDVSTLIENTPVNARFLYSAFSNFDSADTKSFFENAGVPLKTERGNRVFPVSDNANDIAGALKKTADKCGVNIVFDCKAERLICDDNSVTGVKTNKGDFSADAVILACGGVSYPVTGSDGTGYRMAQEVGHTVVTPKPSLVPIVTKEKWVSGLSGLTLKNIEVKLFDSKKDKVVFEEFGELLFTHFGVSGPVILSLSSHIREMEEGRYYIFIDLKPALSEQKLEARLLRETEDTRVIELKTLYRRLLPSSLASIFGDLCGVDDTQHAAVLTKEQRRQIMHTLKHLKLSVSSFRPVEEAIITSGGISVKEIDPKTMESKLVSGLHFAGEMIDVDAYTGGFNLQIAFSTGYLAGSSIN